MMMKKLVLQFACLVLASLSAFAVSTREIVFDNVEGIAVDQPRVAVEVYDANPFHSYGPEIANFWLLDTGAQGLMAAGSATEEMKTAGYQTVNSFQELGVGGHVKYDVSEVYQFDFAGSDGQRLTLENARLLSSDTAHFGSFGGIVGMPAMMGRITTLNISSLVDPSLDIPFINVAFTDEPSVVVEEHRYTVPLQLFDYPVTAGQINPDDALPTYAPLPFVGAVARHQGISVASESMVLDTGAQISIISSSLAYDRLGLSEDDALGYIEISGVSGSVSAPVLAVDELRLATEEGVDIVFRGLELLVVDIHEDIDGIFGCDLLTAGYFEGALNTMLGLPGEKGFFDAVHFSFLDGASLQGAMWLDINSAYHEIIPEPSSLFLLALFALSVSFSRSWHCPELFTRMN